MAKFLSKDGKFYMKDGKLLRYSDHLTWLINKTPTLLGTQGNLPGTFYFNQISTTTTYTFLRYAQGQLFAGSTMCLYNSATKTWSNEAYRLITFTEKPTGPMLTWLQANAVPQ